VRSFGPHLDGFQDTGDQLAAHIWGRAAQAFARERAEKDGITAAATFERRRLRLRRHLLEAIGGLPEMPPRVAARCTGRLEEAAFTIELLLLETLPGVLASAALYLPRQRRQRAPGVLFLCGHTYTGKGFPEYQRVCRALARAGLVVLALDPLGLGERSQYVDPAAGRRRFEPGTPEHCYAGMQCQISGFGIARYFIADAMQALTYLAARPEVDAERLGVTGSSGGGTQSSYLMFLDDRVACGMPCNWITSREAFMATGLAHCSEDNIAGAVREGLNYDDLAGGIAPRPVMLGAAASDFFCLEGTIQAFERLRRVYSLYGRPDDVYLAVSPGPHAYSAVLRTCAVRFFRRCLLDADVDLPSGMTCYAPPEESPVPTSPIAVEPEDALSEGALRATRSGEVLLDLPQTRTVHDLNLEAWRARRQEGRPNARPPRERLREAVAAARPRPPLWVRETARGNEDGVEWVHRYGFTEPGIAVAMIELRAAGSLAAAPLHVAALPEGTAAAAARPELVRARLGASGRLLLFDTRGQGAVAQRPINDVAGPRAATLYRLNYDAIMLGDSLLAMCAFDALRVLEYAHRLAGAAVVEGEGVAGLALLIAAALDGKVSGGRFSGMPASFGDFVAWRLFPQEWALEVHGLTQWPDVPELLACVPGATLDAPLAAPDPASWPDWRFRR